MLSLLGNMFSTTDRIATPLQGTFSLIKNSQTVKSDICSTFSLAKCIMLKTKAQHSSKRKFALHFIFLLIKITSYIKDATAYYLALLVISLSYISYLGISTSLFAAAEIYRCYVQPYSCGHFRNMYFCHGKNHRCRREDCPVRHITRPYIHLAIMNKKHTTVRTSFLFMLTNIISATGNARRRMLIRWWSAALV